MRLPIFWASTMALIDGVASVMSAIDLPLLVHFDVFWKAAVKRPFLTRAPKFLRAELFCRRGSGVGRGLECRDGLP